MTLVDSQDKAETLGYVFDMLLQLARLARSNGEERIAMALSCVVAVFDDRVPGPNPDLETAIG